MMYMIAGSMMYWQDGRRPVSTSGTKPVLLLYWCIPAWMSWELRDYS